MSGKVAKMDPTSVPAETVLELATINGVRALGLSESIGSLEVGKKADFVAIDCRAAHLQPWQSPVSAVVYSATGRDVELVVIDGRVVVEHGKLTDLDEEAIWREGARRAEDIVARAGLTEKVKTRWPTI